MDRGQEVEKDTLNKDVRNLNAFLNWAAGNRFVSPGLEIKKVKVAQKPVAALSPQQVKARFIRAQRGAAFGLFRNLVVPGTENLSQPLPLAEQHPGTEDRREMVADNCPDDLLDLNSVIA